MNKADDTKFLPIEVVDAFREYGWDCPRVRWTVALRKIAPAYSLPMKGTRAADQKTARLIARCKRGFLRGQYDAKKYQPAITAKACAMRNTSRPAL
jgi:hypothetical protein